MNDSSDLAVLVSAMCDLRKLAWLAECVTAIRAFRVAEPSDFTFFMKEPD